MNKQCVVPGCKNSKGKGIVLYEFPLKNYDLCLKWLKAIKRDDWMPTKCNKVCSEHFKNDDFKHPIIWIENEPVVKLNSDAIPCRNLPQFNEIVVNCPHHLPIPLSERFCCIWGCTNNSVNNPKNVFHVLPISHELTICDCIGLSQPIDPEEFLSKSLEICDQHFKQNAMLLYINSEMETEVFENQNIESTATEPVEVEKTTPKPASDTVSPMVDPLAVPPIVKEEIILTENDLMFDFLSNKTKKSQPSLSETINNKFSVLRSVLTTQKVSKVIESDKFYDIDNICRLCLKHGNLRQIYGGIYNAFRIRDIITSCINLKNESEKKFPQSVCAVCLQKLIIVFEFQSTCKESTKILETYVDKRNDVAKRSLFYDHGYNKERINLKEIMKNAGIDDETDSSIEISDEVINDNSIPSTIIDKIKVGTVKKADVKISKKTLETIQDKRNIKIAGKEFILAKAFTCKICRDIFFTEELLKTHKCVIRTTAISDTNSNDLTETETPITAQRICETCKKVFKNEFQEITHTCNMNAKKCYKCYETFENATVWTGHKCDSTKRKGINKQKPKQVNFRIYNCKECKNKYISFKEMVKHKKLVHPKESDVRKKTKNIKKTKKTDKYVPKCTKCKSTFTTSEEAKQHRVEYHSASKIVTCPTCLKQMSASAYKAHKKVHLLDRRYCCEYCGKRFKNEPCFQQHINKVHLRLRPYVCNICDHTFSTNWNLLQHRNKHLGIKKYMCDSCGITFAHKNSLESHIKNKRCGKTKDPTIHGCPSCEEKCNSANQLKLHRKEAHGMKTRKLAVVEPTKNKYLCEICEVSCDSQMDLRKHKILHYERKKGFDCSVCKRKFTSEERLLRHQKIHTLVNARCEICSKGFYTKLALRAHIATHTSGGAKKFSCVHCGKQFSHKNHLIEHTRTHTGAKSKPYRCPHCDKTFALNANLTVHLRTHTTGARLIYSCNVCGESFYDSSSRKKHIKQKHGYETEWEQSVSSMSSYD